MASEAKPFLPRTTDSNESYDIESDNSTTFRSLEHDWKRSCIQILLTFFLASALGFFLGHNSVTSVASKPTYGGLLPPDGNITQIWQHNLTFSQAPTAESEAAWDSYVPPGRGFIHQPDIAPFISNIAHTILTAYYAAQEELDIIRAGTADSEKPNLYGAKIDTGHVRHCFDYVRRGIMCAADTNLEVVDPVNHTTNGWGQEKICRDYGAVMEYATRWANSTDKGIVTGLTGHQGHS
ncbi:hypothetical protein EYC84_000126 [Monilinia fructicola]|uniref:Uncharacterized protein n=1 Tax=Monilinia fructicola TaxID=38448 RepID=A0A5M9JN89_MONFR|nr:hypothetical protein EYC84_000126 [Monilinia fructicola]